MPCVKCIKCNECDTEPENEILSYEINENYQEPLNYYPQTEIPQTLNSLFLPSGNGSIISATVQNELFYWVYRPLPPRRFYNVEVTVRMSNDPRVIFGFNNYLASVTLQPAFSYSHGTFVRLNPFINPSDWTIFIIESLYGTTPIRTVHFRETKTWRNISIRVYGNSSEPGVDIFPTPVDPDDNNI